MKKSSFRWFPFWKERIDERFGPGFFFPRVEEKGQGRIMKA
jgi:hypothetical protein